MLRLGLVFASILASMALDLAAADNVGIVVASKGASVALSRGGSRELRQGDSIFQHDEIVTSNKSFVVLQFTDGSKVTVRPDSTMIIEHYAGNAAELNLVQGGLRVITGAMAKSNPENYKVRTPVALMGVRGTEFSILLCEESSCSTLEE